MCLLTLITTGDGCISSRGFPLKIVNCKFTKVLLIVVVNISYEEINNSFIKGFHCNCRTCIVLPGAAEIEERQAPCNNTEGRAQFSNYTVIFAGEDLRRIVCGIE